jgi:hypothetical protein
MTAERGQLTRLYLGAGLTVLVVSFLPFGSTGVDRTGSLWEMPAAGNIPAPIVVLVFTLLCVSWPLHHAQALVVGYTLLATLLMALILVASLIGGDPVRIGAWLAEAAMVFCLVRSIRIAVG